jgi:hypothetical protein
MTDQELLDEVNKAIKSIMSGGQEYNVPGLGLKRPDLPTLMQMRKELQAEIKRSERGGGIGYQVGIARI